MATSLELDVGITPSQHLVVSNMVYIAPGQLAMNRGGVTYVSVEGGERGAPDYVFVAQELDTLPLSQLAFNKMQRTCCKLSPGMDKVVARIFTPPKKNFMLTSLDIEIDFVNPKKVVETVSFDIERLTQSLKKLYTKHVFSVDQMFLVEIDGNMCKFTVKQTEVLNEDEGTIDRAAEGLKPKYYMGMVTEDTALLFKKPSGRNNMKFTNVPEGAQAMNQTNLLKTEFNFSNYGIGGLDHEADQVFRRAFASRIFPASFLKKLGVQHVKGILLYGPPGCGKTLMARKIGKMLNCKEPKIVNGPEILSKFVGESEKNIRLLFADAEKEQQERGDESDLHLIIFDEFDAIVKQRGSTRDNTGVGDNVVNQLLSKIDGVDSLNNVLLVGMTNRRDLIDEALLRPGRFEVQIEIKLPDRKGRHQIFTIHTRTQKESGMLAPDVCLDTLADRTKNYTGAEIEGVVKAGTSFALNRLIDYKDPTKPLSQDIKVTMADLVNAMADVKPAFGAAKDLDVYKRNGIFNYGPAWEEQIRRCMSYIAPLRAGGTQQVQSVLLEGSIGSGKTALAAYMAECSDFPFIKVVSGDDMTGFFENSKVNYIKKAFDDAHKSPYSVVVLDELEDLIDYTVEGPRFSAAILQTLKRMIKRLPPEGHRILVIGTTAASAAMRQLGFYEQWDVLHQVLELNRDDVPSVLDSLKIRFASKEDEREALHCNEMPRFLPIKKVMRIAEMARALALGPDGMPKLCDNREEREKTTIADTQWRPLEHKHWKQALMNLGVDPSM